MIDNKKYNCKWYKNGNDRKRKVSLSRLGSNTKKSQANLARIAGKHSMENISGWMQKIYESRDKNSLYKVHHSQNGKQSKKTCNCCQCNAIINVRNFLLTIFNHKFEASIKAVRRQRENEIKHINSDQNDLNEIGWLGYPEKKIKHIWHFSIFVEQNNSDFKPIRQVVLYKWNGNAHIQIVLINIVLCILRVKIWAFLLHSTRLYSTAMIHMFCKIVVVAYRVLQSYNEHGNAHVLDIHVVHIRLCGVVHTHTQTHV